MVVCKRDSRYGSDIREMVGIVVIVVYRRDIREIVGIVGMIQKVWYIREEGYKRRGTEEI